MGFMRVFLLSSLAGAVCLVLATAGCSSTGSAARRATDSLRAENATLRAERRALADSIQFYDDIDSGRYYRELRAWQDQAAGMAYELSEWRDNGRTLAVFTADDLFDPGTADLKPAGIERLDEIITQLQAAYPDREIRIEGHSDNTPLSTSMQERFASNWELSSARATAVVRHFIDASTLDPGQFVAVAYGDTEPLTSNETRMGRRMNRRVRIAVLPEPRDHSGPLETAW